MSLAANQIALANLMQSEEGGRSMVAALAFLVWDVLTTLDDEVSLLYRVTPGRSLTEQVCHMWMYVPLSCMPAVTYHLRNPTQN